jgi:hypothetical protein
LHLNAKVVKASKSPLREMLLLVLEEILRTEVLEFDAVAEHDRHISEHGGSDGQDRLLRPTRRSFSEKRIQGRPEHQLLQ